MPLHVNFANEVRVDETRRELDVLVTQVEEWLVERKAADTREQFKTQLDHLGAALTGALGGLRKGLDQVRSDVEREELYATCRSFDEQLMLVRRIWAYFDAKWAQREDGRLAQLLAAADEIVWSCHADPMREVHGKPTHAPAPLPYVESTVAPEAIPRREPPGNLMAAKDDALLGEFLNTLAIPVVSVPPRCVSDPWWLVLLAHEVGHHLQFDLGGGWRLVGAFRTRLLELLRAAGADEGDAQEWSPWAEEIFADAVSVCAVGSAAVFAVRELEVGSEYDQLRRDVPRYPPRVVRHALLDAMAIELSGSVPPALEVPAGAPELQDLRAAAETDLTRVTALAQGILRQPLDGVGTLPQLFGWGPPELDREDDRRRIRRSVGAWRLGLLGKADIHPIASTQEPRHLISAAVDAWQVVAATTDAGERETLRADVAKRLLGVLPDCREDLTRTAEATVLPDSRQVGDMLSDALIRRLPSGSLS